MSSVSSLGPNQNLYSNQIVTAPTPMQTLDSDEEGFVDIISGGPYVPPPEPLILYPIPGHTPRAFKASAPASASINTATTIAKTKIPAPAAGAKGAIQAVNYKSFPQAAPKTTNSGH